MTTYEILVTFDEHYILMGVAKDSSDVYVHVYVCYDTS